MVKAMIKGNKVVGQEAIQLSDWELEAVSGGAESMIRFPRWVKVRVRVKSTGFNQDSEEFSPAEVLQVRVKGTSPVHETFGVRV